jgi:hypothetical protein
VVSHAHDLNETCPVIVRIVVALFSVRSTFVLQSEEPYRVAHSLVMPAISLCINGTSGVLKFGG